MTREEAIIQLDYRKDFATPDQIEAIDMAIEALEQEPFINKPCIGKKIRRVVDSVKESFTS